MRNKGFNKYKVFGVYTAIYLEDKINSCVRETFIDTKNLNKLIKANLSWRIHFVSKKDNRYYVTATEQLGLINGKRKTKTHTLHRFILDVNNSKILVDHIDHNYLNNREYNLRKTNEEGNLKNRKSKDKNNSSGYRNVSLIEGFWRVQLQINKKNKLFPEKFTDVHKAGKFAEQMRQKHYKEYAGKS